MTANETKKPTMLAFQFDLHILSKRKRMLKGKEREEDTYTTTWDKNIFSDFINEYNSLTKNGQQLLYRKGNFIAVLEEFKQDADYVYGKFIDIEYGTVAPLRDSRTWKQRENPKKTTEGEEEYTHFVLRKSDGLLLLQYHLKLTRAALTTFFSDYFEKTLKQKNYIDLNICTLLSQDFLTEIQKLDTIKGTKIEITSKVQSDENEFVRAVQNEMDEVESNSIQLFFKAKYKNNSLKDVVPFINKYNGKKGVTSIKVSGTQGGADKSLNAKNSSEKFKPTVKVDSKGNYISESLYEETVKAISDRPALIR